MRAPKNSNEPPRCGPPRPPAAVAASSMRDRGRGRGGTGGAAGTLVHHTVKIVIAVVVVCGVCVRV